MSQDCNENNFPLALGEENLINYCKIWAPEAQCAFYHEVRKQLGCQKLAVNWSRDAVQIVLLIKLPFHDGRFEYQGNPKFFHVKSMANYHLWGYIRSKISIPNDLILEIQDNGLARTFTGCFRSESTSNVWRCQTNKNTHSEYSSCVIQIYNGKPGNCPGIIYIFFSFFFSKSF